MDMKPHVGRTYIKTLIREIRQSMGRFLAIFAIVALGVGFLAGILQATPDMRASVDSYYRKNSMADIFIKSTMGLTEDDLKKVSSLEGIESVMPAYVTDVIMDTSGDESFVTRVYGLPLSHLNEEGFVNSLTLAEGRLPQKQGECLVQEGNGSISHLPLGTALTISRENPGYEDMDSTFSVIEYTVVGIVENPFYISVESETSTVGNGRLGAIVYTDEASYSLDVYTDFYITLSNTDGLTSFTTDYEDYAESFVDKLNFISKKRCRIRYASVMSDAKRKLDEGRQSFTDAKQEAAYMANGEKELSKIEYPQWYVLDRNSNISYASYKANVKKVEEIAKVFPIFFLLVSALVALTTMTRMIEEERIQIGTLKALGYSKSAIISKYMVYCGLASLLGSACGLLAGFQVLPRVIYIAYATMYTLPPLKALFSWSFAIISCFLSVFITVGATYLACRHTLRERPARLMLPMTPKAGKRILLEKIRFIWSRLSFNYKATARNLFRYKKHFIMTIMGIAGCTALILTGFGLKDSLNCISDAQYDQLFKYDLTIALKEDASIEEVIERLQERSVDIDRYTGLHTETVNVETKDGSAAINLFCSDKNTPISDFVALRNRKTKKAISSSSSSVILTEKLAEILGVSSGDTFKVKFKDSTWAELTITGVAENYVGSYLYMGYDAYKEAYGNNPSNNSIIAATGLNSQQKRDEAAELILSDAAVSGVSFVSQTRNSFENLLSSINYIVAVIIMAAGALAVIVLYNLTNININERKKELATLKVLGFHNWEVAAYIYREIILLTLIGTLVGLGLGVLLHIFVISRAESTDLMFGRSVKAVSFLLSAAFTLLFSTLVDLIMYKKIMDIEMVDSMKAVD